jgi:hypothetical protein
MTQLGCRCPPWYVNITDAVIARFVKKGWTEERC